MNKKRLLSIVLAALCILMMGVMSVSADTTDAPYTDAPDYTEVQPTDVVVDPQPTEIPTEAVPTEPTDVVSTEPTEVPTGEATQPAPTQRPTEFLEDPGYDSDYTPPSNAFAPGHHDTEAKDWVNIDENEIVKDSEGGVSLSDKDGGYGGFGFDKSEESTSDEKSPLLFILALIAWFLALGCVTFAVFYRPSKATAKNGAKNAKTGATGRTGRSGSKKGGRYASSRVKKDDYNDGY